MTLAILAILALIAICALVLWNEARQRVFPDSGITDDPTAAGPDPAPSLDDTADGESDPPLHSLGAFDPRDARPLLDALRGREIPFFVDADHSELADPLRPMALAYGTALPASKIVILVTEDAWDAASEVILEVMNETDP